MGMKYKRGHIWWVKYYRNGQPMRESTKSCKESDANQLLKLREGDIAKGLPVTPKIGRLTVDELLEAVTNDYEVNKRKSFRDAKGRIKNHLLPYFGGRKAVSITTSEINKYIAHRQQGQDGASNATVNREVELLKRGYSLALQGGTLLTKPHCPMLKENNVRTGFFEREQFESVRKHLPEHYRNAVTFCYITGWRSLSEVLPLQWRQVDFKAGIIRLEPGTTKSGKGRTIFFQQIAELRSVLEEQKAGSEILQKEKGVIVPWVFHRKGKRIIDFRKAWATACNKAGLPGRYKHDFRRTAVRNLVRAGISENTAMEMTGHKTRAVFDRYDIVSESDLKQAATKLNESMGTMRAQSAHEGVQSEEMRVCK